MEQHLSLFLKDPILIAAAAILTVTFVILLWAVNALRHANTGGAEFADETTILSRPPEQSGLLEARLQEIAAQLAELNRRLGDIEKSHEQTMTLPAQAPGTEKIFQQISEKLDSLSKARPAGTGGDDFTRLEAKLEGIHKLLIYLTDSK